MSLSTKTSDFSQNSSVSFHRVTFDHSILCVVFIDEPNESCQTPKNLKEMPYPPQKKAWKRKGNSITPAKTNTPISQTSSERLKLANQANQMKNKGLKLKLGQLQEEISKASLPVSTDLSNDFKSIIFETDQIKISPFMGLFWEEQQKHL